MSQVVEDETHGEIDWHDEYLLPDHIELIDHMWYDGSFEDEEEEEEEYLFGFAQVEVDDMPELYDIQKEAKEFEDAIEELDNTWDDAEAQIKWWETVPIGWPVFVGTWTNTWGEANDDQDLWNGDGNLVVNADGSWNRSGSENGTAWWDGRSCINVKFYKGDTVDRIGTFVDGYLRLEDKVSGKVWLFEKDGYTNYPSSHAPAQ